MLYAFKVVVLNLFDSKARPPIADTTILYIYIYIFTHNFYSIKYILKLGILIQQKHLASVGSILQAGLHKLNFQT